MEEMEEGEGGGRSEGGLLGTESCVVWRPSASPPHAAERDTLRTLLSYIRPTGSSGARRAPPTAVAAVAREGRGRASTSVFRGFQVFTETLQQCNGGASISCL